MYGNSPSHCPITSLSLRRDGQYLFPSVESLPLPIALFHPRLFIRKPSLAMGIPEVLIALLAWLGAVCAQKTCQQMWNFPASPDFAQTLPLGVTVPLAWNSNLTACFDRYAPSASSNNVDLWITDYDFHIYSHKIGSKFLHRPSTRA